MLLTTTLLVFSAALQAGAAEPVPGDRVEAFRIPACSTAAAASWRGVDNAWLRARTPTGWSVVDRSGVRLPSASTTTYRRLSVYLDASAKAGPVPKLLLTGSDVSGKAPAAGAWLAASLADARSRGDLPLGAAGPVPVSGRGLCELGVVERNAPGACPGAPGRFCRQAVLHLDCGTVDATQLIVAALTPPYPNIGAPDGKAAEALSQIKTFLCTLESKK